MRLEGSCHCGAVRFSLNSRTPYPFMRCYCTVCRKTAGGGGYAINLAGEAATLEASGETAVYRVALARLGPGHDDLDGSGLSPGRRHFCPACGSALWAADPRWPELVHPFASAIDTALPRPPETVHMMLAFAAPWVVVPNGPTDRHFAGYPDESIEAWHRRHGLISE